MKNICNLCFLVIILDKNHLEEFFVGKGTVGAVRSLLPRSNSDKIKGGCMLTETFKIKRNLCSTCGC